MPTNKKRIMVTIEPEWEPKLDELKRNVFYNTSASAMLRYIMERGLNAIETDEAHKEGK
jgi:hypothetical protein